MPTQKLVKFVFQLMIGHILKLASSIFPSKENLIVFSMIRGRYWDNSKALFEFIANSKIHGLKAIWLMDPHMDSNLIPPALKDSFVNRHSLKAFYFCCNAKVAIICYGLDDFGVYKHIIKNKIVVMLWHAITIKNCGLLDNKFTQRRKIKYVLNETRYYDAVIASSQFDMYYIASFMGIHINKVHITGLPRNDKLFDNANEKINDLDDSFKFLYAPTFRDYDVKGKSLFFPFDLDFLIFSEWARNMKLQFYLRPHPSDASSVNHVVELSTRYSDVFINTGVEFYPDVIDLLKEVDAVITDYSSVYVDGLARDLPSIFCPYDYDLYQEKRGIAYDYDLICPGPKVNTCAEFKLACLEAVKGSSHWNHSRTIVRKMFFAHTDSRSCSRVSNLLRQLILTDKTHK